MSLRKLTIPIRGMRCRSCELMLEEELAKVAGVKKCETDWQRGEANVYYSSQAPSAKNLERAVRQAGDYEIGAAARTSFFSRNAQDYKDLFVAFLFLVGGYFILKGLNFPRINLPTGSSGHALSFSVVILIGLAAGFSTCLALVGGLVMAGAAKYAQKHPDVTPKEKFRIHIMFNLGRIAGYMFFGTLLGALGSILQLSAFTTGTLTIGVGLVMLVMGLQLTNVVPGLNSLKFTLPKSIGRWLGIQRSSGHYTDNKAMVQGALTFFLPCGFTQAMQLYAISSGNFAAGGLIMGLFALGTAPGLLSVGGVISVFKKATTSKFFKFAGVVVVALALFNINNGFNLTGWNNGLAALASSFGAATPTPTASVSLAPIENDQQVVRMTETNSGYSPNQFTIKKGVPAKRTIDAQAPYSCAGSIVMSKYNIRQNLTAGENVIEFTPQETGRVDFSCSMGMYRGAFFVVDENGQGAPRLNGEARPEGAATPADLNSVQNTSGEGCGASTGGCSCGH